MKFCIFILLQLLSVVATAQPYASIFGKDSTRWAFRYYNLPGDGLAVVETTYDTLFEGEVHKVLKPYGSAGPAGISFMKEDTLTGKVWYKIPPAFSWDTTKTFLAFDYSLEAGDTFMIPQVGGAGWEMPTVVDSVQHLQGKKHIFLHGYGDWHTAEPYVMIEGSGGNMGPMWKAYGSGYFGCYLICVYKDGIKMEYEPKQYSDRSCGLLSVADEYKEKQPVLYPNPATNQISFISPSGDPEQITIFSIDGTLMGRYDSVRSKTITLDHFAAGFYYLKLSFKNKESAFARFSICR